MSPCDYIRPQRDLVHQGITDVVGGIYAYYSGQQGPSAECAGLKMSDFSGIMGAGAFAAAGRRRGRTVVDLGCEVEGVVRLDAVAQRHSSNLFARIGLVRFRFTAGL